MQGGGVPFLQARIFLKNCILFIAKLQQIYSYTYQREITVIIDISSKGQITTPSP